VLFLSTTNVFANEEKPVEKKSFDLKEMIFHHVLDSYEWHLMSIGERNFAIPLPVILKSADRGWFVFSSANLEDGKSYDGFYIAHGEKYNGKIVEKNNTGAEIRPLDLSLTKNATSILISSAVLLVVFLSMARTYKKNPLKSQRGLYGTMEMLIMSIYDDVIKPSVGPEYKRFAPYLLTVFFFILLNNFLGLIPFFPGGANVTGNIAVTMVLALCTFFITNVFGSKEYYKEIFWPDVPLWLKLPLPIMPFVELLGVFTKPFALMIRLFANMLSGHMIILVLMGLIFIFNALIGPGVASGVSVLSILFSIFMLLIDVLVSFIQAYVFTMLSAIFIGLGRVQHHSH
jgi:F-type H+-transporting ATPase subunit a